MSILKLKKRQDGIYACGHCGWIVDDQEKPWLSTCPVCPTLPKPSPYVMVGDLVERMLTRIGITKQLVERVTRTKPGGCGCQGRQKWLNEAGVLAQRKASAWTEAARRFYLGS